MKNLISILILGVLLAASFTNATAQDQEHDTKVQKMEEMIDDVEGIEKKLARCYSEVCQQVRENSEVRSDHFLKAKKAFQNGDMEEAKMAIETAHSLISTDVELLETDKNDELTREILILERELEEKVSDFMKGMEG